MVFNSSGLAVGITVFVLVTFSILAAIVTYVSRKRMKQHGECEEDGRATELIPPVRSHPSTNNSSVSPFASKKHLPRIPKSYLPTMPQSPGIRVSITTPSTHRKASNDSLPSVETVLKRFEAQAELEAASKKSTDSRLTNETSDNDAVGQLLPNKTERKTSLWERRNLAQSEDVSESKETLMQPK